MQRNLGRSIVQSNREVVAGVALPTDAVSREAVAAGRRDGHRGPVGGGEASEGEGKGGGSSAAGTARADAAAKGGTLASEAGWLQGFLFH